MGKKSVLYIIPPALSHRTAEENLGVGYLASFLRGKGYHVGIIDAWLEGLKLDEIFEQISQFVAYHDETLFFGISTYLSNIDCVSQIVIKLKQKYTIPIVAGGFGPSFFKQEFLNIGIDYISYGEGEICSYELCQYFEHKIDIKDVGNVAYYNNERKIVYGKKSELIFDLDELPFPARDTVQYVLDRKSSVNVLSARGCMGHCTFCSVIAFQKLSSGKIWRGRSISNFVDEIENLYKSGITFFKVIDDSFIEYPRNVTWCKDLADELEKRHIHVQFRGSLIADYATDEILQELKRAGFFSFSCGIESFAPTALRRYGKRAIKEANCNALEAFKKNDIYVQCGLILFDPYTTINELKINLYYLKKFKWIITKGIFSELYAAEGTIFTNKLLLESGTGELKRNHENYKYIIQDHQVRNIYDALKKWHKRHAAIYDLLIDPLTSPKNISLMSMRKLYELYLQIHEFDLLVLEDLINLADSSLTCMYELVNTRIEELNGKYVSIGHDAMDIYVQEQLMYDGILNKYL